MNILEAMQSGRKFRRKGEEEYLNKEDFQTKNFYQIEPWDMFAEDYELDSVPVEISKDQLLQAIHNEVFVHIGKKQLSSLCKALGFEE